jgi:5'-methylthioadenosine phosphorylase
MSDAQLAFIGGTGLYDIEGLQNTREVQVPTPFGDPSDAIVLGRLQDTDVAFLPRHGRGHTLTPTNLPSRANIYALKTLGVERIVSVNAVGGLADDVAPRQAVVPDQLIDRTRRRVSTFFEDGIVAYVGFAEPFCPELSPLLADAAQSHTRTHRSGTMVVMDGPAFSTRAESRMYRQWGGTVVGMTVLPEAKLAREAEMCYSSLSLVTDRDSWHEGEAVSVEAIAGHLQTNVAVAKKVLADLVDNLPKERSCECGSALSNAIITSPDQIPAEVCTRLGPIIKKYL